MSTAIRCVVNARLLKNCRYTRVKSITNLSNTKRFHSVLSCQRLDVGKSRYSILKFSAVCNASSIRSVSNDSGVESTVDISTPYIPEPPTPPVIPDETLVEIAQAVVGEPSLASLGLCNYTPAGLVQAGLEFFHISMGLPWWGSIIAGTIVVRLCMFPLVILAQRNSAKMNNNLPQMQILQQKMTEARNNGDHYDSARYGHELMTFMKEKEINPMKSMLVPFVQAPVFISVFIGLRKMANLPVESFTTGGLLWFTDLTQADPFYILPLVTCATLFITLEIGAEGGIRLDSMKIMRYVLRAIPIILFPFTINFPTALVCYWTASNFITLIQVAILRTPGVREYFKIQKLVKHTALPSLKKSFKENVKDTYTNAKIARDIQDRKRADELAFRKAGVGPIQKTYSYDPTKNRDHKPSSVIEAKSPKN